MGAIMAHLAAPLQQACYPILCLQTPRLIQSNQMHTCPVVFRREGCIRCVYA